MFYVAKSKIKLSIAKLFNILVASRLLHVCVVVLKYIHPYLVCKYLNIKTNIMAEFSQIFENFLIRTIIKIR